MLYYIKSNIEDATAYVNSFREEKDFIDPDQIKSSLFLGYSDFYPTSFSYGGLCFHYDPIDEEAYHWIGHVFVSPTVSVDDEMEMCCWSEGDKHIGDQLHDYTEFGRIN